MQSRSIRRSGQPTGPEHCRMRAVDRDLIRGGHYGQRSCEPHSKAEHMAAPTNAALVRKALPTRSRPHMALSCLAGRRLSRPLSGVKRTPDVRPVAAANDPKRTSASQIRVTGRYGMSVRIAASFRLNVREFDHLGPLLGLRGDEAKLGDDIGAGTPPRETRWALN